MKFAGDKMLHMTQASPEAAVKEEIQIIKENTHTHTHTHTN
jgi:hypothetical protein